MDLCHPTQASVTKSNTILLLVSPLSLERFVGVFDASMLDIFRKNSVHESPGVPILLILEVSGSDGSYLY